MTRHVREWQWGRPLCRCVCGLISPVVIVSGRKPCLRRDFACFSASRSVRTEMLSALVVAQQTIENAIDGLRTSHDPRRQLENLGTSFKG